MPHHAGPAAERERLLHEERDALVARDAEVLERARERALRRARRGAVFGDEVRQIARPRPTVPHARVPIEVQEARVQTVLAPRQRPVGEALVEERAGKADEHGARPRVRVDAARGDEQVAVPDARRSRRRSRRRRRRGFRSCDGLAARLPERHIIAAGDGVRLAQEPRERVASRLWDPVLQEGPPQYAPRQPRHDGLRRARPERLSKHRVEVALEDAPAAQLVTVRVLREERLAAEQPPRAHDRLLEGLVLERVQRVVVDEDADRPLRRERVGHVLDNVRDAKIVHRAAVYISRGAGIMRLGARPPWYALDEGPSFRIVSVWKGGCLGCGCPLCVGTAGRGTAVPETEEP